MGSSETKNNENLTEEITWGAQVVSLGIDTSKFSYFLRINEPNAFFSYLQQKKQDAINAGKPIPVDRFGRSLNMHLQGGVRYPYHLSDGDIDFFFKRGNTGISEIRIEIGANSCWYPGEEEVRKDIINWIENFANIVGEKISEVHPYVGASCKISQYFFLRLTC